MNADWVIPVPPLSKADIARIASVTLERFEPEALLRPRPVNVIKLVDHTLPAHNIDVYPATASELPGQEAHTQPFTRNPTVLIREDQWAYLMRGGGSGLRARATVAHELGHVVLHVPVLRRHLSSPEGALQLNRVDPAKVKTYADPEWQAWCFAGAFLVPPRTLAMLDSITPERVAETYHVSERFARWVLRIFGDALTFYGGKPRVDRRRGRG